MTEIQEKAQDLAEFSREYGQGSAYVLAGGGNSSVKFGNTMLVKASGSRMGTIAPEDFVAMDLPTLQELRTKVYPADPEKREEQALADLMAARKPGEEKKRPSVETLLHSLFPQAHVMHTHPGLVNGMTCGVQGKAYAQKLFGDSALWIPIIEPGYILAKTVDDALKTTGKDVRIIFLENHGVFISGDSHEEIRQTYDRVMKTLEDQITDFPKDIPGPAPDPKYSGEIQKILQSLDGAAYLVEGFTNEVVTPFMASPESFLPLEKALTPDHIVYAGFKPLYAENEAGLTEKITHYYRENQVLPKILVVKGVGCFGCAGSPKAAIDARELFLDAVRVVVYSRAFGGPLAMPPRLVDFIRNWEVEKYRASK